jgi:hypothetical protein
MSDERAYGVPDSQKVETDGLRVFHHPALFKRKLDFSFFLFDQEITNGLDGARAAISGIKLTDR